MTNSFKFIALATIITMTTNAQAQKSTIEQHNEVIAEKTQRLLNATRNGSPSSEEVKKIVSESREKIKKIWEAEQVHQNERNY